MRDFFLSTFTSFYELMVAFSFAYTGIESFRVFLQRFSLHEKYNEKAKSAREQFEIHKSSRVVKYVGEVVKSQLDNWDAILCVYEGRLKTCGNIVGGYQFIPVILLTGVFYLAVLIIIGFSHFLNPIFINIVLCLFTILCCGIFSFVLLALRYKITKEGTSRFLIFFERISDPAGMIKWFCGFMFVAFGISALLYYFFNDLIEIKYSQWSKPLAPNYLKLTGVELYRFTLSFLILVIPNISFLMLLYRHKIFLDPCYSGLVILDNQLESVEKQFIIYQTLYSRDPNNTEGANHQPETIPTAT